jgi:hypothetical protein
MLPIAEQVRGNSPVWKVVKLRFLNDAHSQLSGHLNRDLWRPLTQTFKMQFFSYPGAQKRHQPHREKLFCRFDEFVRNQGCQIVHFKTKNPNLGKF